MSISRIGVSLPPYPQQLPQLGRVGAGTSARRGGLLRPQCPRKTTLLEAVYLLAIARSFRAENEREVLNFRAAADGGQGLVGGTVEKEGERLQVFVGYRSARTAAAEELPVGNSNHTGPTGFSVRKEIRVSRVRRTAAELVGTVNAVLFSADDLRLVQGPPSQRRRFLDILISQADTRYLRGLLRYQKVVQQRNQLLRMLQMAVLPPTSWLTGTMNWSKRGRGSLGAGWR